MADLSVDPSVKVAAMQIAEQIQKNHTPDFQTTQSGVQALHERARFIGDLAHEILVGLQEGPPTQLPLGTKPKA
jgi:hypothetical protein